MLKREIFICVLALFVCIGALIYLATRPTSEEAPARQENILKKSDLQDESDKLGKKNGISELESLDEKNKSVYVRPKLYQADGKAVDEFLSGIIELFPESQDRLLEIIKARLGTPYELGCLGEGSGRDPDPIFRLDVADCTVLILTTAALLNSSTVEEAEEVMKRINYHPPGEVSYQNRLHFTTYRNLVSPYFTDITAEVGQEETKTKTVVLNRTKDDGKRLIDIGFEEEIEITYIPTASVSKELLSRMPLVAGVAFLKDGDERIGLDIRHEGFILSGSRLVHASSQKRGVVEEDFSDYLFNGNLPRFDGIVFFELFLPESKNGELLP